VRVILTQIRRNISSIVYQSNVLIDSEGHVRLTDMGLCDIMDGIPDSMTLSYMGSSRWEAPELIAPNDFGLSSVVKTPASDAYAFACFCVEVSIDVAK
jgi:serine/threonine protein kinase